jgi:hypothetical protein
VIVLNKLANSCQPETLGIKAGELVRYLLRHAVITVLKQAL